MEILFASDVLDFLTRIQGCGGKTLLFRRSQYFPVSIHGPAS